MGLTKFIISQEKNIFYLKKRIDDAGFRMQDAKCRIQKSGVKKQDARCTIHDAR
jgi:hypothetical protein